MRSTPNHDDGTVQDRCHDQNATAGSAASATTTLSNANAETTVHASRSRRETTGDVDTLRTSSPADYDARLALAGAGPPLVYVPGMDGTGELFYRQLPALTRRFRAATYRLRDAATQMQTLVDDLAAVLRAASPAGEPAVLVGESFGGTLALSFALAHPERVRALVILNSFPFFRPQHRLHLAIAGLALMPWGAMRLAAGSEGRRHFVLHAANRASNVVRRPTQDSGKGYEITGHHEIMVPLLAWAIVERLVA